jgi:hypothetical protein
VDIPLNWQESHYLKSAPGDQVVVARKAKEDGSWYVAGISDEQARGVALDFSFLEKGNSYVVQLIQDSTDAHFDKNPTGMESKTISVKAGQKMKVWMAEGGGFVMKISQK